MPRLRQVAAPGSVPKNCVILKDARNDDVSEWPLAKNSIQPRRPSLHKSSKSWISNPVDAARVRNFRKTLFIRQKLSLGVK
jgi:hypothetical protein